MNEDNEDIRDETREGFHEEGCEAAETGHESTPAAPVAPAVPAEPAVIWEADYQLTEEEWLVCFKRSRAGAPSRLKTGVRVAILGVLSVGFAAYYLLVETNGISLLLAILCAGLLAAVYGVPIAEQRRALRVAAASPRQTRLREVADGLEFGTEDGFLKQPFSALTMEAYPDMVIVGLPGGQRLAVPRRAVTETAWQRLCARATESKSAAPKRRGDRT